MKLKSKVDDVFLVVFCLHVGNLSEMSSLTEFLQSVSENFVVYVLTWL